MSAGGFLDALLKWSPLLEAIGTWLEAIGILLGGLVGLITYFAYYKKTANENWGMVFRALYAEFWNSNEMAEMRRCLVNEDEYNDLKNIINKRLSSTENLMTLAENKTLESVDRFCALMVRIVYFGEWKMDIQQRGLYNPLFSYWLEVMSRRSAFMSYVEKFWPTLHRRIIS